LATQVVLDKGFHELMAGNRIVDLRRMYQLFSRVNKHEALRGALGTYIKKAGQVLTSPSSRFPLDYYGPRRTWTLNT